MPQAREMHMLLRQASLSDLPAILDIYAQYMDTPITFELEVPAPDVFARRMRSVQTMYPWLAAEENGKILGYAYAHCPWERAAYQWNAELSIYLDRQAAGKGLGKRLYKAMLSLLACQNVRCALGCVTVPNAASERLHASLGFKEAARFERSGYKNNAWHDVVWFSLPLVDDALPPSPLIPFADLPKERVEAILAEE